jgi:SAM-dependent methyltransferase
VSATWKEALLEGADGGGLPAGYRREGGLLGREELLDATGRRPWSESRFVARARTAHTTSAAEARIRVRQLARLVSRHDLPRAEPVLDLGCADGTLAHDLLELGFEKLLSTDVLAPGVAALERSLEGDQRERVLLVVDDMLRMPLRERSFGWVIAWGVLSLTGDFERAVELAWSWVAPGGYLLIAEPLLEQALVYALVRGDLDEVRRVRSEGTRAAMWDRREERYGVYPLHHYEERLPRLPEATVVERGGVSMLPSLVLGGVLQDRPVAEEDRAALSELVADEELDELALWRQAFWMVRKG